MLKQIKYFQAVADFTEKYPDVGIRIINGCHEELYDELRQERADLVLSDQRRAFSDENEQTYYRDIVGIKGEYLFAENLEEARLLVIGGKGFMPVEGDGQPVQQFGRALHRVPLLRNGKPIKRNYCAFWKADNSGYYNRGVC